MVNPEDHDQFDDWYRVLRPRVVATLAAACGSFDDATDATDEAFATALERWDRVRVMDNPDGWTYRVALNLTRKRVGRRSRERELLVRPGDDGAPHDDLGSAFLEDLVSGLPPRMREVIVLRHVADLTEPAIASALGISRGTVSSTLRDAHERLARQLDRPGPDADSTDLDPAAVQGKETR